MALNFSDSDKAKYMTGQYRKEIRLYFPQLNLTVLNDQIYEESLSLEEAIFDGNGALSVIGCISNRFSIEIRNQGVQLKNKTIQVSIKIDNGSWNRIFTGYVESAPKTRDKSYQKLQCFDMLHKYEAKNVFSTYNGLTFPCKIKTLRDAIFNAIGISQQSISLENDDEYVNKTVEDGELAAIDVIRAVCEGNGVFGKINADGTFKYLDLTISQDVLPYPDGFYPDEAYPVSAEGEANYIDKYYDGTLLFEDYEVATITGVTVRDGTSDTSYGQYGSAGNMLLIEGNMLFQGLNLTAKNRIAQKIFNKVQYITYKPFEVQTPGLPYIECADAISIYVYDYSSGEPVTDIMSFSVMARYLKGIQWLTDQFKATGDEYQPEVQPVSYEDDASQDIDRIENEISGIDTRINGMSDDITNLQNLITYGTSDMTPGSSSLTTGHVYLMYE